MVASSSSRLLAPRARRETSKRKDAHKRRRIRAVAQLELWGAKDEYKLYSEVDKRLGALNRGVLGMTSISPAASLASLKSLFKLHLTKLGNIVHPVTDYPLAVDTTTLDIGENIFSKVSDELEKILEKITEILWGVLGSAYEFFINYLEDQFVKMLRSAATRLGRIIASGTFQKFLVGTANRLLPYALSRALTRIISTQLFARIAMAMTKLVVKVTKIYDIIGILMGIAGLIYDLIDPRGWNNEITREMLESINDQVRRITQFIIAGGVFEETLLHDLKASGASEFQVALAERVSIPLMREANRIRNRQKVYEDKVREINNKKRQNTNNHNGDSDAIPKPENKIINTALNQASQLLPNPITSALRVTRTVRSITSSSAPIASILTHLSPINFSSMRELGERLRIVRRRGEDGEDGSEEEDDEEGDDEFVDDGEGVSFLEESPRVPRPLNYDFDWMLPVNDEEDMPPKTRELEDEEENTLAELLKLEYDYLLKMEVNSYGEKVDWVAAENRIQPIPYPRTPEELSLALGKFMTGTVDWGGKMRAQSNLLFGGVVLGMCVMGVCRILDSASLRWEEKRLGQYTNATMKVWSKNR